LAWYLTIYKVENGKKLLICLSNDFKFLIIFLLQIFLLNFFNLFKNDLLASAFCSRPPIKCQSATIRGVLTDIELMNKFGTSPGD